VCLARKVAIATKVYLRCLDVSFEMIAAISAEPYTGIGVLPWNTLRDSALILP